MYRYTDRRNKSNPFLLVYSSIKKIFGIQEEEEKKKEDKKKEEKEKNNKKNCPRSTPALN